VGELFKHTSLNIYNDIINVITNNVDVINFAPLFPIQRPPNPPIVALIKGIYIIKRYIAIEGDRTLDILLRRKKL
jgi:hypothetical protein